VQLANEFQKLGDRHFQTKNYAEAQRAYEHAQLVINSPVVSAKPDSNLIYNTALAAWENKDWEKATGYLDQLNTAYYSPNVSHLLYLAHLQAGDTLAGENALVDGIERYEENEELVLLLVDLLVRKNNIERAIEVLDTAALESPSKHIYPYTKGLVYQKAGQFNNAIEAYQEALQIAPDNAGIYSNIGTCNYNIGVEIDENARTIINKSGFLAEKEKAKKAFESAAESFRKVLEKDADNSYATAKLYQLSKVLGITVNTN
jgi:tetratricopeptide (TPR) repeat protein